MKSRLLGILSLLVLVLALAACDGSSGSSSSSSSSGAKGAVAAAPMKLAKVYGLSTDGENVLIGTTDNSGAFAINSNAAKLQFPAVVWSVGGWNVNDAQTPAKEFKGTLKGVMASADSAVYLTPANSLVAAFFEKSGNLADAKQQVESLLKYEMGLKSADPLGNPLTDLNDSEIVAKSLMHFIGAGDENNGAAMELLSAKLNTVAEKMSSGMTFSAALKTMPESPYFSYTAGTLCTCVTAEANAIAKEAKDSLGDLGADLVDLEKMAVPNITSDYPAALNFNGLSSTEKESNTVKNFTKKFKAVVTKGDSSEFDSHTMRVNSLINVTLSYEANSLEVGEEYSIAKTQEITFNVDLTEVTTFPYTASFTLETIETEDLPTFSRTFTITFFDEDEFAVKEVAYDGDDLFAFAAPSTADGEIAEGATSPITADTFAADVELVNSIDSALADGNMDVRFIAPAGLAFTDLSENADIVTVKSFNQSDKTYTAVLPAGSNFIAKDNIEAGFKTVRIQVIDQDGETIARTTKDIVFVPEDQKDNLTGVSLTAQTLAPTAPTDDKYAPASIDLAGTYRTWVKEANPEATTGGITALSAESKVILMSKTGNNVFYDGENLVDRITIPVTLTEDFKFTSTVTNFVYNYSNANDDIKMVFMLDPEDTNKNIESPTLLKLRFEAP